MRPDAVGQTGAPASHVPPRHTTSMSPSFQTHLDAATADSTVTRRGLADTPVGRWLESGAAAPGVAPSRPSSPSSSERSAAWSKMVETRANRTQRGAVARQVMMPPVRSGRDVVATPQRAPAAATAARNAVPAESTSIEAGRHVSVGPAAGLGAVTVPAEIPLRSMSLVDYPRPPQDNGRGLHWIPTTSSTPEVVDRFVAEAKAMHATWAVVLNEGLDVGRNDYLVKQLVANGIEPVMRIYTPGVAPLTGDIEGMVRHYRALGVDYFQLFNEPNLRVENGGQEPSVDRYLDAWIPAARSVAAAGGLPGFGALAPGGDVDDLTFLREALDGLEKRGAIDTLDRAWISMHNYTGNRPIEFADDSNGFLKFRWYDRIVQGAIGRSLPIVGTEGGTYLMNQFDPSRPPVDAHDLVDAARDAMSYVRDPSEPYLFANSWWVIANAEGGGHDPRWEPHALFRPDGESSIVGALRELR